VSLAPLKGGLTNISYVATDGMEKFVVRCGEDIPVHHVFRDRERAASRAAHASGLSPEVVHAAPGILVLRFIEGRTFEEKDLGANVARIVPLLKTCHREVGRHLQGPANAFWVFHVIRDYVRLIGADPKYLALADWLEALQVPLPMVFGHHDLLPGNLMDDGTRLWLIDWEYGAFGTPLFDLANLCSNSDVSLEAELQVVENCFERAIDGDLLRRYHAMKCASLLREAMWSMISEIHSTLDFDYRSYTADYLSRFERAYRDFERL